MIEALETPDIIGEARVKMGRPLLLSRDVDRVVFVGDTHTAVDVTQTVFDKSPLTNVYYGFLDEVTKKLGDTGYESFREFFQAMPYAVVVNNYLCVHGGIASGLEDVSQIAGLPSPDLNPDDPMAFELLWNDPRDMIDGFVPSLRGEGAFYFGTDVTEKFLQNNSLKGIIRGHEVVDGFREDMGGKVITVFSSRYHGGSAGALILDQNKMEQTKI